MTKLITALILLTALAVNASDIVPSGLVTFEWTAPTEGSTAVRYIAVAVSDTTDATGTLIDHQTPTEPRATFTIPNALSAFVRVAGVDDQNRVGPWSDWSAVYKYDPGPPTGCGLPVFVGRGL